MSTSLIQQSIAITPHSSHRSPMAWLAAFLRPLMARSEQHTRAAKAPADAAHEAAAIRALAYRHLPTDPSFAADLFAAANRGQSMVERDTVATPATPRR